MLDLVAGIGIVMALVMAVFVIATGVMLANFGTYIIKETWDATADAWDRFIRSLK